MTRPEPQGPISEPMAKLRLALAASAAFQTFSKQLDSVSAQKRIHSEDLPLPLTSEGLISAESLAEIRPFAQLEIPDGGLFLTRNSESPGIQGFDLGVTVHCTLEQNLPDYQRADPERAALEFRNLVGLMAQQVFEASGVFPYADVAAVSLIAAPYRANRKQSPGLGDCYTATLAFTIGTGSEGG